MATFPISYVSQIDGSVIVYCANNNAKKALKGVKRYKNWFNWNEYYLPYNDHQELAKILMFLRDKGFALSAGKQYSPAEIVEYLATKKLFKGDFKEIAWRNPETYFLYNVNPLETNEAKKRELIYMKKKFFEP